MRPIDYLRGVVRREPAEPPATAPESKPPRDIPWTNAVRTAGACTHDVIYSGCRCASTNISAQTNTADFRADQQQSTI